LRLIPGLAARPPASIPAVVPASLTVRGARPGVPIPKLVKLLGVLITNFGIVRILANR
jgi:hypothetical protein